jgi:hypothetical protein
MAIKFNCPHCNKAFNVKDALAGKKAACTGCKKIIVIPKPQAAAAPAEDLEALAVSALVEPKPDPATAQESATIDFECPQCGEQIKVARELAGKNAPCPECRRIVRVPMPKTKDGADWRNQGATLPSGARRDTEPAPEGAWEPSRARGVSTEALAAAGLIPKKKKPGWTRRQKITYGVLGGLGAVVLLVVGVVALTAWAHGKQDAVVSAAAEAAEKGPSKEAAAEANRAAGEYFIRTDTRDAAQKAQKSFAKARDLLEKSPAGPARDALLADLLASQVDLGDSDDEAINGKRLRWTSKTAGTPTVLNELKQTLSQINSPWGRLHALRLAGRRLIARGRTDDFGALAGQVGGNNAGDAEALAYEKHEALAVVGLEVLRAGDKDLAGKLAERSAGVYTAQPVAGQERPPLAPSVVALCLATGKPAPKPEKAKDDKELAKVGEAAGLALKGDVDEARKVTSDKPEWRAQILVAVAEATGDAADVEAAEHALDELANDKKDQKEKKTSPWLAYRLALAAARTKQADVVLRVADRVSDPGLKALAQLEAVRLRLDGTKDKASDGALEGIDGGPLAQAIGREWLARHNARHDGGTLKAAEAWDEAVRPFGVLGAVLGEQDGKGK